MKAELALELCIATDRIDTIVDYPSAQKYGVRRTRGEARGGKDRPHPLSAWRRGRS